MQSTVHNIGKLVAYWRNGDPKAKPPTLTTESDFLPRRVKRIAKPEKVAESNQQRLMKTLSAMCGYK